MGSFSQTCAISRLPIEAGDKIKVILISQYPYDYISCLQQWNIRTIPINATYDDYGGFECADIIKQQIWIQSLNEDIVEIGFGENIFHDIPVSKNMTFEQLQECLIEDRISLFSETNNDYEKNDLKELQDKIKSYGFQLYQNYNDKGYIVTSLCDEVFVIRTNEFEADDNLKSLEKIIPFIENDYAVMMTAASYNSYNEKRCAELTVRKKPGTRENIKRNKSKQIKLRPAMIRQDVWESLIKYSKNNHECFIEYIFNGNQPIKCKKTVKKKLEEIEKWSNSRLELSYMNSFDRIEKKYLLSQIKMVEQYANCLRLNPKTEMKKILKEIAELAYIKDILQFSRILLYPSAAFGPQYGCWDISKDVNEIFQNIAKKQIKEQEK